MEIIKNAIQNGFEVDKKYHDYGEIQDMYFADEVVGAFGKTVLQARVCKEIKVVYDSEKGRYHNIAITNSGKEIAVIL